MFFSVVFSVLVSLCDDVVVLLVVVIEEKFYVVEEYIEFLE